MLQTTPSDPLRRTGRITLELSNQCNYSQRHSKCPAHYAKEPRILSESIVDDVIDTLGELGFGLGKYLAFHLYNEPLIDRRLFSFVQRARRNCPHIRIILWSNGWYLDQTVSRDLIEAGITDIMLSAYSDHEFDRLNALRCSLARWLVAHPPRSAHSVYCCIRRIRDLDDRLHIGQPVNPIKHSPCGQPLDDLIIRSTGDIGLCCFDFEGRHSFGNLYSSRFRPCLIDNYGRLVSLADELAAGIRSLPLCQTCINPRRSAEQGAPPTWREDTKIYG